MLPLIIRRKLSIPTLVESSQGGKQNRSFYSIMEHVKTALTVDLQDNAYCSVDPHSPSPDGNNGGGTGGGLGGSFAHLLFRTNRFSGRKIEQGESSLDASGSSSKSKKKNKKKSAAVSPVASKPSTPVEDTVTLGM